MIVKIFKTGQLYGIQLKQGGQSFQLGYHGAKAEALWMARMFRKALAAHDKVQAAKVRAPYKAELENRLASTEYLDAVKANLRSNEPHTHGQAGKNPCFCAPEVAAGLQAKRKMLDKKPTYAKAVRKTAAYIKSILDLCPKCGHVWSRHMERWGGIVCAAREIDASDNYDGYDM